jgi:hypothetical protein
LPYFIYANYSNGTVKGFVSDAEVGDYSLEFVGIDDSGAITIVEFTLSVKRKFMIYINLYLYSMLL